MAPPNGEISGKQTPAAEEVACPPLQQKETRLLIQALDVGESTTKEPMSFVSINSKTTIEQLRPVLNKMVFGKDTPAGPEERSFDTYFETARNGSGGMWCKISKEQEKTEAAVSFAPVLQLRLAKKQKKKEQIEEEEQQGFEVVHEKVFTCSGEERDQAAILLRPYSNPRSQELLVQLKKVMRESCMYEMEPKISVDILFNHIQALQKMAQASSLVSDLLDELNEIKEQDIAKMARLKEDGIVTFSYLQHLFPAGMKVYTTRTGIDDQIIGGEVVSSRIVRSFFSNYFEVKYYCIRSNGKRFFRCQERASISAFSGTKKISDLGICPMTDEIQAKLEERGRKFAKAGLGAHYLAFTGNLIKETWCGPAFFKAAGRVMIDGVSFERNNPHVRQRMDDDDEPTDSVSVAEEQLYMCWPTLQGFSFAAKKWGEIDMQYVDPIQFDEDAFNSLVLAPEKKDLVKGLVCNYQTGFGDIISGKGGGCIFLLHGSPGTGKTLTAEAIAELLKRPLYSVSVGELGTDTAALEKSLREILEVASAWNAVVLLDEADIFLEKRTENDITRNAMVGIFLRLLEYHQGVLFLTTNRVKSFDSAFHSRISVALRYPDLSREDRVKVWTNLLMAARVEGLSPEQLAEYELNGRQIKTTIRLAQALAQNHGVPVAAEHIRTTVDIATQFNDDLANPSES